MGQPLPEPPPGFDEMPVEEQLDFVNMLWERIARHPATVPVPEWHRRLVLERRAAMERDGDRGIPWEEVRRELEEGLAKRRR